ncbi:MAG: hypothetical protein K0R25_321 [Rickettsiaceae bacterium]|jgi:hypothetical protein|nr:hypothetical protein [Rickettsiaceae bacterium]
MKMRKSNLILALSLLAFSSQNASAIPFFGDKPKPEIKAENSEDLATDKIDQNSFSNIAIVQVLDKINAKSSELKINVGAQASFGKLVIKVKKCWKSSPEQRPENKILVEVEELGSEEKSPKKQIFYGWLFSSSPSISGIEHPIYDITAISCQYK